MFYPELPGPGTGTVSRLGTAGPGRAAVAYPSAAGGSATVPVGRGPESRIQTQPEVEASLTRRNTTDRRPRRDSTGKAQAAIMAGGGERPKVGGRDSEPAIRHGNAASQDSAATVTRLLDTGDPPNTVEGSARA